MEASVEDRVNALRERAQADFPEAWIANENDAEFVGFFQRLEEGRTSYGPAHVAVFNEAKSGEERAVWLLHTVLKNAMARAKPEPGELVAIRYLGKRNPEGGGAPYEDYRVVVDRPYSATTTWDELNPDAGFEPQKDGTPDVTPDEDIPF